MKVPASFAMLSAFFDRFSCAQILATVLKVASNVVGETKIIFRSQANENRLLSSLKAAMSAGSMGMNNKTNSGVVSLSAD
jgi:hypothetical protein